MQSVCSNHQSVVMCYELMEQTSSVVYGVFSKHWKERQLNAIHWSCGRTVIVKVKTLALKSLMSASQVRSSTTSRCTGRL